MATVVESVILRKSARGDAPLLSVDVCSADGIWFLDIRCSLSGNSLTLPGVFLTAAAASAAARKVRA